MFNTTRLRIAQEEPEQLARHAEIARRYAWDDRRRERKRRPRLFLNLRLRDLERFYAYTYGPTLPDDDAGRAELFNVAQHIFQGGAIERHFPAWASLWAPWLDDDECADIIARVIGNPVRWTADTLAWRIGLNDATRTRLGIRTIGSTDVGKAARAKRRKLRNAAAHRARRKIAARPASAASSKPWQAAGMSRATWYRRRSAGNETVRLKTSAADRTTCCGRKESHQGVASMAAWRTGFGAATRDGDARLSPLAVHVDRWWKIRASPHQARVVVRSLPINLTEKMERKYA